MNRVRQAAKMAVALWIAVAPTVARGFPDYSGTRALGMGDTGRADARAGQAPLMNPAGMSLARSYTLEGGYQYMTRNGGYLAHASVVDSTSGFNLAGALFYSYRSASPPGDVGRLTGHEPGVSLSFPFGDRVLLGVSGKYLHLSGGPAEADGRNSHSGFTLDAGAIVRAGSLLTVAVVGYNLRDLSTVQAPVGIGYGVALRLIDDLVIALDGAHDFTTHDPARGVTTSIGAGAEYLLWRRMVFRVGGGRDGRLDHNYVSAGLVALSELGALDFGVRQDISGEGKVTFIGLGVRLFVPQP